MPHCFRALLVLLFCLIGSASLRAENVASESAPEPSQSESVKRVRLIIKGLSGEVKANVSRAIELKGLIRKQGASEAQIQRLYRRAPKQIEQALEPFGYYQPVLKSSYQNLDDGSTRIRFEVELGAVTKVRSIEVNMSGPGLDDKSLMRTVRRFKLKPGSDFVHGIYETSKADVIRSLQARGYFDAQLELREVRVFRSLNAADIKLSWSSGPRYLFGPTRFEGSHLDDAILSRYLAYAEGDAYDQRRLLELQQRLTDADFFSAIEVEIDPEQASELRVPVNIKLEPAKRSIYTGGVSLGTDSGAGVRAGLERRYVNRFGHKLLVGGEFSQRLEQLAANYRVPRIDDFRSSYGFGAALRNETTDSFESETLKLSVDRVQVWKRWLQTLSVNFLDGDFVVGGPRETSGETGQSRFVYPEWRLERKEADDFLDVRRGWSLKAYLRGAAKSLLSDADFLQAALEGKWIRALGERQRILIRALLGATASNDFDLLPPELRYFAGGDLSIRGFDFQALGPTNERGGVVGGRYAAVASFEYEYALDERFAVAGFIDAGNAFSADEFEAEVGVGLGLRWRSPVGMVRLDLGVPVTGDGGLRPHLVIGPDL
jgi:translocation and assembly module TamA